jgi:hypothetical protein
MTARLEGRVGWSGGRDDDGYREYTVTHLVEADAADGPAQVLACPGLPAIGSLWSFGSDADSGVWCWPYAKADYFERKGNEPHTWWTVEQKFSNKVPTGKRLKTCLDEQYDNPLLEPQKVSGTFVNKQQEAYYDKDGAFILTSTYEQPRGDVLQFDGTVATVKIEQNVAVLNLYQVSTLMNCVNSAPLWGMPVRCVKLSRFSWERKLYGTCSWYYTRSFEFDVTLGIMPATGAELPSLPAGASTVPGFDRYVLNECSKSLTGRWVKAAAGTWYYEVDAAELATELPDPLDRTNYSRYTDKKGELDKRALIDNATGIPVGTSWETPDGTLSGTSGYGTYIFVQKYAGANFLLLGIPTQF